MADGAALFAQPCRFFFASDALSGHFGHVGEVGTAECLESLELPGWQTVRCLGQKNGHDRYFCQLLVVHRAVSSRRFCTSIRPSLDSSTRSRTVGDQAVGQQATGYLDRRHPLTFLSPWNVTRKFGLRFGEQLIHLTSHLV